MKKMLSVLGIVLVMTVSGWTPSAEAVERGTPGRNPDDTRRSHITSVHRPVYYVRRLPAGYRKLKAANVVYYHRNGVFFRSTLFGYQWVRAPLGVAFRTLTAPLRVSVGKITYFVCNDTYFIRKPAGYFVASSPGTIFR
ncbi:MAG: DUF6515 family protein [Candidatus Omnitrophota bacterium]